MFLVCSRAQAPTLMAQTAQNMLGTLGPHNNIVLWEPSLPEHTRSSVTCCSRHENTLVLREPHLPARTCGQPHAFAVCILQPGQCAEILGINKLQNTAHRSASQALRACPPTHLSVAFVLVPRKTLPSKALFTQCSEAPEALTACTSDTSIFSGTSSSLHKSLH